MNVVVFGATGHLGAYTAKRLLAEGHAVVAVGRRVSDNGFWASLGANYLGGVNLEAPEAFSKLPRLARACKGARRLRLTLARFAPAGAEGLAA